jgi:hypothetical protein
MRAVGRRRGETIEGREDIAWEANAQGKRLETAVKLPRKFEAM